MLISLHHPFVEYGYYCFYIFHYMRWESDNSSIDNDHNNIDDMLLDDDENDHHGYGHDDDDDNARDSDDVDVDVDDDVDNKINEDKNNNYDSNDIVIDISFSNIISILSYNIYIYLFIYLCMYIGNWYNIRC